MKNEIFLLFSIFKPDSLDFVLWNYKYQYHQSLIIIKQRICLSLYKLTPKREVLLKPNLIRRYPKYEVRILRRGFFENRSRFVKIQILTDCFSGFFRWLFFSWAVSFLLNIAHFRFWLYRIEWKILFQMRLVA